MSWLDLAGHTMFGLGIALTLAGFAGRGYFGNAPLEKFFREYYPHMVLVGGFISGILISVRLGPYQR